MQARPSTVETFVLDSLVFHERFESRVSAMLWIWYKEVSASRELLDLG